MQSMRQKQYRLSLLITLATALASHCPAFCRSVPLPPEAALRKALVVFTGTVVKKKGKPFYVKRRHYFESYQLFEFRVTKAWKGTSADTVLVATQIGTADSGVLFRSGRHYLVYAYAHSTGKNGRRVLVTSVRAGTKRLEQAKEDLAVLSSRARTQG